MPLNAVLKNAFIIAFITFFSRVLGYIRDAVIAAALGATPMADAFLIAFRIPNFLKKLFSEGALSITFIPLFSEIMEKQGLKAAYSLVAQIIGWITGIFIPLIFAVGYFAGPVFDILMPAEAPGAAATAHAVLYFRIMLPYVFLIGLSSILMAVLNVRGYFAGPAAGPFFFNLCVIAAAYLPYFHNKAACLSMGVLTGGFLQLAILLPAFRSIFSSCKFTERNALNGKSTGARIGLLKTAFAFPASVVAVSAYHVNVMTGAFLASDLPSGSISGLYFADRLVQFPLGLFVSAFAVAVLPELSKLSISEHIEKTREELTNASAFVFFIIAPAMTGMIVLKEPFVTMLFQRGLFDAHAAQLTSRALMFYALGIWAYAHTRVTSGFFIAGNNTAVPFKAALVSIGLNIVFGIVLKNMMGYAGIALAASLSAAVQFLLLVYVLFRKKWLTWNRALWLSVVKPAAASGVMALSLVLLMNCSSLGTDMGVWALIALIITGALVYTLTSLIMRSSEIEKILDILRKKNE